MAEDPSARGKAWHPIRSPLDPFIRKLLRVVSRQGGKGPQSAIARDLEQTEQWAPDFFDTLLRSAVAKGYVAVDRRTGQARTLRLTQRGHAWLQYQAQQRSPESANSSGTQSTD